MAPAPKTAYPPGTQLTVGSHKISILQYISEGGFAHVYTCNIVSPKPPLGSKNEVVCLKRVAVPNKMLLNILRAEVEAMKRLKGKPHIVSYIDSHASRISSDGSQGYEVLLLMEYCSKHGLIDFMNTRLTTRLSEAEVLRIMYEITLGVLQMHFLDPPLVHRDIKIENVLINDKDEYQLCDFGSACGILRPPQNPEEFKMLQSDILQHTTAQYRSPEMIDLTKGFPIDEKADIWALGVFLYKLCYYTTPFESGGEMALLQGTFAFPHHPQYSVRLKNMITILLNVNPNLRPNIYQVLKELSLMRGMNIPI
ncbi:serine/threonine protein kinase ARK1, partial [Ascoidea rubescens DSM 1968]